MRGKKRWFFMIQLMITQKKTKNKSSLHFELDEQEWQTRRKNCTTRFHNRMCFDAMFLSTKACFLMLFYFMPTSTFTLSIQTVKSSLHVYRLIKIIAKNKTCLSLSVVRVAAIAYAIHTAHCTWRSQLFVMH